MSSTITPDVLSAAVSEFNAGANYPVGRYQITYVDGALQYAGGTSGGQAGGWSVNFNFNGPLGYHVTDGNGNDVAFPATTAGYANQAACEAANAGNQILYAHAGGTIGMYLHDTDYNDNTAGYPAPTFSMAPAPAPPLAVPTLAATGETAGGVPAILLKVS